MNPAQPIASAASGPNAKHRTLSRIAYSKQEAAEVLGMSEDSFDRYVRAHVPCVRRGRLRIYAARDLERWLAENAELAA